MAITGVRFELMGQGYLRLWVEAYPGRVNEQDIDGCILLSVALGYGHSMDFLTWLVDEEGADIETRDRCGRTGIFHAPSHEAMSFLLDRDAELTVKDNNGCTPLIHRCWNEGDGVERLLQDHRVLSLIDVQAACDHLDALNGFSV